MKFTSKKLASTRKPAAHDLASIRQKDNFERFMQEKADVFQVTDAKVQAMFWTMD